MSTPCALTRRQMMSGLGAAFACAAAVPPASAQQRGAAGNEFRLLRAAPARVALRNAGQPHTDLLGYDGAVPGPVLRVRRGEELRVRLDNALGEPTALHWHGLRGANALAGAPPASTLIAPGASGDYRIACPDAGTFWYRAPSPAQSGRGLHGVIVVEESEPIEVDRDVALALADWRLGPDGALAAGMGHEAASPSFIAANGAPAASIAVRANERLRLRLVNAGSGVMQVRIDRHPVFVMALDGQPAEPFAARDGRIFLAPGNRADLFVDMALAAGARADIIAASAAGEQPVAHLVYAAGASARLAPLPPPPPLPANPLPQRIDLAGALKLDLPLAGEPAGDGRLPPPLSAKPAFSLKRGRAVSLGLANPTDRAQVVHLHGHAFRLLDRLDDGWKPFWLDTLLVPAGQTARIAFVADQAGAWAIESRAEGGGAALATWFAVA